MFRVAFLLAAVAAVALAVFTEDLANSVWRLSSHPLDGSVGNVVPLSPDDLQKQIIGKRALIIGGTKGIGAGTAVALARSGAASVGVVGRSAPDSVLLKMEEVGHGQGEYKWERADLGSVKGCLDFVDRLLALGAVEDGKRFDFLVLTVGAWPNWSDRLSADGVDKVLALDIVARYVIMTRLAPLLAPGARVMSVLASTTKIAHPSAEEMKRVSRVFLCLSCLCCLPRPLHLHSLPTF